MTAARQANRTAGRPACRVMISGCCGGGKSTLIAELARRGFSAVLEPGRRIIAEELASDGSAHPRVDPAAFARRAIAMSIADHEGASGLTFFDRGVVDAWVALKATGQARPAAVDTHRYDHLFLAPPWPEIYVNDEDRLHSFEKALSDFERVRQAYLEAGYRPVTLPLDPIGRRANFVIDALA